MVNELIGLQLITVIWKPEGGERIDRFTADYCDMDLKTGNELKVGERIRNRISGIQLITVIWKPEGGERIDRLLKIWKPDYCDYCDMET